MKMGYYFGNALHCTKKTMIMSNLLSTADKLMLGTVCSDRERVHASLRLAPEHLVYLHHSKAVLFNFKTCFNIGPLFQLLSG